MDVERDWEEILRLYETTRRGHLDGDVGLLLAQYAPRWDDLRDGTVVARTIEEERARIGEQLAGMRYLAWDDVMPPRIEVSADGTMAWLLGEIRARAIRTRANGSEEEFAYRCSWLQVYAKRDGRWVAVVNAPSVKLESE